MSCPRLRLPFERSVRAFDPDSVTSRAGGAREALPYEVGLEPTDVDAIWRSVVSLYSTGLSPAIALCLMRRGQVVIDRAIGHARGNAPGDPPGAEVPVTPATPFTIFSASKMITAMLVHLLDQRRLIHLDDPIDRYLPGFGQNGKQWITIRHVLTHRAGIPSVPQEHFDVDLLGDRGRIIELLSRAEPVWRPGRRLAYHALTGGYVLGAVIEAVTGKDVRQVLHDEIEVPLGLAQFNYGVPADQVDRVAENAHTGSPVPPIAAQLLRRAIGVSIAEATTISNDPRFLTAVIPAGNIVTTAHQAARFMQLLLAGGQHGDVEIFEPRTIQRAIAEQSYLEIDLTLAAPIRYGMGFMLGTPYFSIYGRSTERTFGHLGFTNVVLYADPERDISVCLLTSGKPFAAPGLLRWLGVMRTIARRCPEDWGR